MQFVFLHIRPSKKTKTSGNDQSHNGQIYYRVDGISCQRGILFSDSDKIKTCIAKCGNRMENRIPDSLSNTKIFTEHRRKLLLAPYKLDQDACFQDKFCQADDPSYLMGGNSFLHGTSLHQTDLSAGSYGNGYCNSHHAHTADLDQGQDDRLAELRPVGCSVMDDQSLLHKLPRLQ